MQIFATIHYAIRRWLLALVALALALPAHSQSPPTDVDYDGTREGFAAFVERTGLDWPVPAVIGHFQARDGARLRYAHWAADPAQRAGVVVFFSGRTEYIEKNIYTYRDLQANHYDVWTLDWRGQGLSARSITQYPDRGHIDSFDTFVADAATFIDDVVGLPQIDDTPKYLLAHSMGGAIATLYLQSHPGQFDRAVFSAPMHGLGVDNALVRGLLSLKSPASCATTLLGDCPWESNFKSAMDPCDFSRPASEAMFRSLRRAHLYSHDLNKLREQFCIVEAERRAGPPMANLGLGRPTVGWMTQAFAAIRTLFAQADQLSTPLLIIGGGDDDVVSNESQQAFCDAATAFCCRLETAGASHELLIESEPMRRDFMNSFYDFTSSSLSAAAWCERNS